MVSHPDIIFKSNDLVTLPKETLITLLKNDDLNMDEDDIWMSVIQWGTKQVPELELGSDPDSWSSNNINTVKDIIADCMPHIRFSSISLNKIVLYNDLIPGKLRRDILNYHTDKNYKPNTRRLPPRAGRQYDVDSLIINNKQAEWISSKIVESTKRFKYKEDQEKRDDAYKLTLLYRQSRDGGEVAKFRELCNNKGPTIAVGKVLGTEEIVGGYNPLAWNSKGGYVATKESFIFALDKHIDKSIVSFVDNSNDSYKKAFYDGRNYFPVFGSGHDLFFGNNAHDKPYAKKQSYILPIRDTSDKFEWVDWEVFLVSKL